MNETQGELVRRFVREWLAKAEGDLQAAETLVRDSLPDYFTAAFHAQQAAEKLLKAFLVRHQIPFPKTHSIYELLELAEQAEVSLKAKLASAVMLTPFGVDFRYPCDDTADLKTAKEAVQQARHVYSVITQYLKEYLDGAGRPNENS